jgi:hypothetical protein
MHARENTSTAHANGVTFETLGSWGCPGPTIRQPPVSPESV